MQITALRTTPVRVDGENKSLEIQNYDTRNDYPQKVMEISGASSSIRNCLSVYTRFLVGKGLGVYSSVRVGKDTLAVLLRKVVADYARFGGFALHCAYNLFGRVSSVEHIPFEFCRLGMEDEHGVVHKIAVNRDWTGRKKAANKGNTTYCNVYNPDTVINEIENTPGGIRAYNGQVLYANREGTNLYPSCLYEAELTDGATQIACANIRYRNAKNGFMPYGMVVLRKNADSGADTDGGATRDPMIDDVGRLQGDVNTGKILAVTLEPGDETPEFKTMDGTNYDGAFKATEESTKDNIGAAFMQPPILRCESVSNGFADDMMMQAYNYYNSVTEPDRLFIEETLRVVLEHYRTPINTADLHIEPLVYGSAKTL